MIALIVLVIALVAAAWLMRDRPEQVEHPTAPDFFITSGVIKICERCVELQFMGDSAFSKGHP